ncbi:Tissue alpha-L-fucosidase [Tyrophagus putrescentiae]|nr:Tissue alpha-L-fucosidase [Tyrophagus putrescentiae]
MEVCVFTTTTFQLSNSKTGQMLQGRLNRVQLVAAEAAAAAAAKRYEPNWKSIDARPLPAWYDQAKVGIFIHFGVFSVPSYVDEWFWYWWLVEKEKRIVEFMRRNYPPGFTYADFGPQLTAEFFNATAWAELFRRSGARTTRASPSGRPPSPPTGTPMDVGPKRDIVGEVAAAVRGAGLRFGAYHSMMEWFHPLYKAEKAANWSTDQFVRLKIRPELEELVSAYQPDVLWSDGDGEAPDAYWNSTDFLAWLYNDSPVREKVVTNDRWGDGTSQKHGGFFVGPDRFNPGVLQAHKEATLAEYMTIEGLLEELVSTVSCGGNLLVNVGPTRDGRIVPVFEERLLQLGDWLAVNGEAIYSSRPFARCQNDTVSKGVWYTEQKEGNKTTTVYGIALSWPDSG